MPRSTASAAADLSRGLLACVFLPSSAPRILIVEDEVFLTLPVVTLLEDMGYEVVGPLAHLMTAIRVALKDPFDAALLDVDLCGESAEPIAEILTRRGIPFAVVTSFERDRLPAAMCGHPYVQKPCAEGEIQTVVSQMCDK